MPENETNPNPVDEANPSEVIEANPEIGSHDTEGTEPEAAEGAESYSREQIEAWRRDAGLNANTQAEYTRTQQRLREIEQERDRAYESASALMGREQQRQDPLLAIDAQLEDAWDPQQKAMLRQQRDNILIERAENRAVAKAMQAFDAREALGGYDANELQRLRASLSPADEIRMLKREAAARKGTLYEDLTAERQAKETRAKNAARLNTPLGESASSGNSRNGTHKKQRMNDVSFGFMGPDKRASILSAGIEIYNSKTGETIHPDDL